MRSSLMLDEEYAEFYCEARTSGNRIGTAPAASCRRGRVAVVNIAVVVAVMVGVAEPIEQLFFWNSSRRTSGSLSICSAVVLPDRMFYTDR